MEAKAGDRIVFQILSANAAECLISDGELVEEVITPVRGGGNPIRTGQWEVKRLDKDGNPVTLNTADYRVHQLANGKWVGGAMAPAH